MNIQLAQDKDKKQVLEFYNYLIDTMINSTYDIGWRKGIYPDKKDIDTYIDHKELYIGIKDNKIISSVVMNHECNESYDLCDTFENLSKKDVLFIHLLAVNSSYQSQGIGRKMVKKCIEIAQNTHIRAIRLDVLTHNRPAIKLYKSLKFEYRGKYKMYYKNTGWTEFELYERVLKKANQFD